MQFSGAASLNGTPQVSLLNGFVPSPSDQFTILTAGSLSGVFANAPSTISFAGGTFDVKYPANSVTLSKFVALPEPGAAGVLAGMGVIALRGRRRRRGLR